ncbi:hypothetical protein B0H10DRAFT_1950563 [Mycena sp. CBHHK59/15]|nr:hypothetical protein B0H10DRAFT_1950563 [Mycena sp. CBHHK59/15]
MMFAFSSFGVPIVFATVLLLCMVVGVTCIWDVWPRRPSSPSFDPESNTERPKLWDLFTEIPVGLNYEGAKWGNLLSPVPPPVGTGVPFFTIQPRTKHVETVHERRGGAACGSEKSQNHIQLAVTIAMPCARQLSRISACTDDLEVVPPFAESIVRIEYTNDRAA